MYRSKATATPEESDEIVRLYKEARSTPVIAFGTAHALQGGASADAQRYFHKRLDEIAHSHGLKAQRGEWGFDQTTGQFLSEFPIEEPT